MKNKLILAMVLATGLSQAEIKQQLGVDPSVDYASFAKLGPWDDRNYQITKEDLSYLPKNDQIVNNVPLFFKVIFRKEHPQYNELYPRSLLQLFQIQYGGLLVDGIWYKDGLGVGYHPNESYGKSSSESIRAAASETSLQTGVTGNEVTIECNPTNGDNCVAGSNGSGGQRMYWSDDAGVTWTLSQVNVNSCCDPAVDWSSDGSIVYQADLAGDTAVRWTRSLDQGHTWEPMQSQTGAGRDKEMIHVDRSPTSPHKDNVYLSWHDANVQKFTRSTDMGQTMAATTSFNAEPIGIGSDITTDASGNIFYVYPSTTAGEGIRLLKSTDGGISFGTGIQISPLNDVFDFPVPSMESRNVFVYTSVDVDVTTNDIYVAWTDQTDQSTNGGASSNHAWINVAKSTDAGATWNMCPHPHATADELTVDRFHPWIKVGENGVVHIGYYDTRHSANRTGVDFYYAASLDGCTTWETEERYTTETSSNISNGQEWGDYNGLSVVLDNIATAFTDNRPSIGQTAMIATGLNQHGTPTFSVNSATNDISVCSGDTGATSTINVAPLLGYDNDVTLAVSGTVPTFISNVVFGTNPIVAASGSSVLTFDVGAGGTVGSNAFTIQGSGDEEAPGTGVITKEYAFNVIYSGGTTSTIGLTAPADNATNVSDTATFTWAVDANAIAYKILIATSPAFGASTIVNTEVMTNSYTASGLPSATVLYWRVKGKSPCNTSGAWSATQTFSTVVLPGDCSIGDVPMAYANYDFESGAQGWTHSGLTGIDGWALSASPVHSGTQAFHGAAFAAVNDTVLVSPAISVPASSFGPLTLQFWNRQEMEDSTGGCYDGGILEVTIDAGVNWTQVAGSKMLNDPYDGTISGSFNSTLAGLSAWCGDPQEYLNSKVDIDDYAGQTVQFRFRKANDSSVGHQGWDIDDVKVMGCATDLIFENGFE